MMSAQEIAVVAALMLISVVFHELSHGLVAYAFGDTTAKRAGRLTLNPLRHIDPIWTILVPVLLYVSTQGRFAIGMAKPVPVNFSSLRRRRIGTMAVSFAGPLANLILAFVMSIIWKRTGQEFWLFGFYLNAGLAVFNLIPIPPLDGSRIAGALLPRPLMLRMFDYERIGSVMVLILYFTGILIKIVSPGLELLSRFFAMPVLRFI